MNLQFKKKSKHHILCKKKMSNRAAQIGAARHSLYHRRKINRQTSNKAVFLIVLGVKQDAFFYSRRIFLAELIQRFVRLIPR